MAAMLSARASPRLSLCSRGDGVVGKQRIGSTHERQVVAEVLRRFGQVHRRELVASGDALIEGSEDAQSQCLRDQVRLLGARLGTRA